MPGYPCDSTPRFSTTITSVDSGAEQVNRNWQHPLYRFTLPEAARTWDIVEAVKDHFMVMGGPAHTWPFRDPLDFASRALDKPNKVPTVTLTDQVIGTGDGATTSFQISKTYERGAYSYARKIELPVLSTVLIAVNGLDVSGSNPWTVTRPGGVVSFTSAPSPGASITAGFLFDNIVRFESDDSLATILHNFCVGGFADITLLGVRSC